MTYVLHLKNVKEEFVDKFTVQLLKISRITRIIGQNVRHNFVIKLSILLKMAIRSIQAVLMNV